MTINNLRNPEPGTINVDLVSLKLRRVLGIVAYLWSKRILILVATATVAALTFVYSQTAMPAYTATVARLTQDSNIGTGLLGPLTLMVGAYMGTEAVFEQLYENIPCQSRRI